MVSEFQTQSRPKTFVFETNVKNEVFTARAVCVQFSINVIILIFDIYYA